MVILNISEMAGLFAKRINAKILVLTHFGRGIDPYGEKFHADKVFNGQVLVAHEFMRVSVPRVEPRNNPKGNIAHSQVLK
jgi:hypothetical protein